MAQRLRIYLDTSVFGGCFDDSFRNSSTRLFQAIRRGSFTILLSEVVITELEQAPREVVNLAASLSEDYLELLDLTPPIIELRDAYLKAGIVGERYRADATHVAMATVARADAIVSWNFKHIVRLDKIKAYNQVNLQQGYGILTIVSPQEVVYEDQEEI